MRSKKMLRIVVAAMLLALPAQAQQAGNFYDTLAAANDGGTVIRVEVNKGKPIQLNAPASSIAIANPAIADVQVVSPRLLFVNGIGAGETSIIAVDAGDNVILQGTVSVSHNISRFDRALQDIAPGSKVTATTADNAIILKGKVDSPVVAEQMQRLAAGFLQGEGQSVINLLDTAGSDQVMLKVRIVEVARNELKRFGINWESIVNTGNFVFGLGQGRDFLDGTGTVIRDIDGDNSLLIGASGSDYSINAVIDALEEDGLVSVLAEPNLTTRSGMQASFLAGGEIPIPVSGEEDTVTIEYREFGVSLQFTPVVLSKDKISLTVLPEVSALDYNNGVDANDFTIPALTTRRAQTTVDLGSGQTFAVAGLLRNDQSNQISKFPILGDVPILGALFRSSEFQNNQTELVILVTPYIVKPVDDASKLATPLDGYVPATDAERILLGKLSGSEEEYPDSRKEKGKRPDNIFHGVGGQAGFLMR